MDRSKLEPYQLRVLEELEQLETRISALNVFLCGSVFESLPSRKREQFRSQVNAMNLYSDALKERIKDF